MLEVVGVGARGGSGRGLAPEFAVLDEGYHATAIYDGCEERGIRPIVRLRQTPGVKAGRDQAPTCEHGVLAFAGADAERGASEWRRPTGECRPGSCRVEADRLHPLVPRGPGRRKNLHRSRVAVEREVGNLERALAPLRVRRIERVRWHADPTILARLASALADRRAAVPLAA